VHVVQFAEQIGSQVLEVKVY